MFLDTSFCVDLIREQRRGKHGPATRMLRSLGDTPLFVSVFALCELDAGARLSRDTEEEFRGLAKLTEFVPVVYPDPAFPGAYGEIEAHLRRNGTPIPTMDVLIAALARLHGEPLLARHTEHFARIPGLVVQTYG
ncbi:MAG TPA: type II toxin-antitoxin system VapC family toxin [Planctomycetota bacterium]|nr:type II toxin-antitoxin system VapC family toxin [Planctomycetota bacterium]